MSISGLSTIFYRNPRLLALALSLILVAGLSSAMIMPRMEDPLLAPRAASVTTILPGADANLVETLVTEKLEDEIKKIQQVKEIRSTSRLGVSFIQIELLDSVTAAEAPAIWSRVRGKVDDAILQLPPDALRPEFEQIDVKAFAMLTAIKWRGTDDISMAVLRRWARVLEERLRANPGTEKTELFGDPDEEIVVRLDQEAAAALGLMVADISRQISNSDAKASAGQIRGIDGDLLLEVRGQIDSLSRLSSTPIQTNREGGTIQLSDIATLTRSAKTPPDTLVTINGDRAVVVGALVRNDYRIDHWTREAEKTLRDFSEELPRGLELEIVFSQSGYVEDRLSSLLGNLMLGGAAVFGVILFLMGWRSALIVGSALPLVSLVVLACLRILDIPIHQMSVTGLIIALGLLIDNAIVVVDEIGQELREGHSALEAVGKTVQLLAIPLLGSTLTTVFAFAPIALMPGPAGEFVGAISISVILAIIASFFLAMTVIPALAGLGISVKVDRKSYWWQTGFRNATLTDYWSRVLDWMLQRPMTGVVFSIGLPVVGFLVAAQLPVQFFPAADRDQLHVELELPSGASLEETAALTALVSEELYQAPGVQAVHWFVGESVPVFYYNLIPSRKNSSRYAQAIVQRDTAEGGVAFVRDLQRTLDQRFPQALTLVRLLEQGPPFYAPIEVRLFGPDLDELRRLGEQVRLCLTETAGIVATRSELEEVLLKINFDIDESQTRLLGLDSTQIARQLNATLEGSVGGSILEGTEQIPIRVRVGDRERADLHRVATLSLLSLSPLTPNRTAGQGKLEATRPDFAGIPLATLGEMKLQPEISGIPRFDGRRMNEVQAFSAAGQLSAPILEEFEARLNASGFELPPGYSLRYGGEVAKRNDAIGNLMANVGVLMVLMVATLVLSFQSFRLAIVIAGVAALSVGLSMGALWLYGFPFGFMAIVGTMGLIGVAINDSIVVLAAIRGDQQARLGDRRAIRDVVVRSTRHIVATTLTTTSGFMPLILAGGAFWPPLAVAISGGILGATILALFFIPATYALTHRQQDSLRFKIEGQR